MDLLTRTMLGRMLRIPCMTSAVARSLRRGYSSRSGAGQDFAGKCNISQIHYESRARLNRRRARLYGFALLHACLSTSVVTVSRIKDAYSISTYTRNDVSRAGYTGEIDLKFPEKSPVGKHDVSRSFHRGKHPVSAQC